jgi:hypothetical protein
MLPFLITVNSRYSMTGYPLPLWNDLQNSPQSETTKVSRDHEGTKLFQRINLVCQEIISMLNLIL